jgi:hypothetical protein
MFNSVTTFHLSTQRMMRTDPICERSSLLMPDQKKLNEMTDDY